MKTEEWLEKAKAYFNGDMTIQEAQLFEKETAASENLSRLMQLWIAVDEEGIFYERNRQHEDELIKTHQVLKKKLADEEGDVKKLKYSPWRWVAVAATVTGIVLLVKFFIPLIGTEPAITEQKKAGENNQIVKRDSSVSSVDSQTIKQAISSRDLYVQNFVPDEIPEDPNGPLDDAFFYYASGQYKKAITAIDNAHKRTLTRGADTFAPLMKFYESYYKALSMLSLEDDTSAIPLLEQSVLLAPSPFLKAKSQWYLALAHLSNNNPSAAVTSLEQLIKIRSAGTYSGKASKLLSALKK